MALGAELNIELPWDPEDAAEWIFPTSCDKKWLMPRSLPKSNRQGFPVETFGTPGEETLPEIIECLNELATIRCSFIT